MAAVAGVGGARDKAGEAGTASPHIALMLPSVHSPYYADNSRPTSTDFRHSNVDMAYFPWNLIDERY
jgi:hypothetical protein